MNLAKLIDDLRVELTRVEAELTRLERLRESGTAQRRGRKSMDAEERRQVSARIRAYWAERRKSPSAHKPR